MESNIGTLSKGIATVLINKAHASKFMNMFSKKYNTCNMNMETNNKQIVKELNILTANPFLFASCVLQTISAVAVFHIL